MFTTGKLILYISGRRILAIYSLFSGHDKGELETLGKFYSLEGFRNKNKVEKPREKVVFPGSPYVIP